MAFVLPPADDAPAMLTKMLTTPPSVASAANEKP